MQSKPTSEGFGAVGLLMVWFTMQFVVHSGSMLIHIPLAAGVVLLVRSIVNSRWGTPTT